MRELFKQIGVGLVSAIAGGIVSIILLVNGWIWSGLFERLKFEVANLVMKQLDYYQDQSEVKVQHVDFSCKEKDKDSKLVTASCVGIDSNGFLQAAVGPVFKNDNSLSCDSFGPVQMRVQATAICFKVRHFEAATGATTLR